MTYTIELAGNGPRPWQLVATYPDGYRKVVLRDMDEDDATVAIAAMEQRELLEVAA